MLGGRSGGMRRCRGAGLAALAAVLLVAVARAEVQQEPSLETPEGSGININCSHPKIKISDYIYWYRQLLGGEPKLLAVIVKGSKELPEREGRLWVSEDRRWSALWLRRPRRGDAAVYYCALGARAEEPGLRPGTNRRGRGRAGPGAQRRPRPAGGAAAPPAGPRAAPQLLPVPRARPHRARTARHARGPHTLPARPCPHTLAAHSSARPRSRAALGPTPNCGAPRLCQRLSPSARACCCSQPPRQSEQLLLQSACRAR
ncbi:uncharacterized protein LOC134554337 [Prinia subflava]|uniref:uncharacterized protein LOC134554337 n=1 Tax=Prinia subflava TaxID=208062 RepID=UPI002FE2C2EA